MQLLPPELTPYEPTRYYRDLEYRQPNDDEKIGASAETGALFHPDITYDIDY